ncbi:MAG TPA: zinc ribbon domain-containing protein [Candidatus Gallacutalibacter pullicola]|uniref:Zinc ribbon domain-containing protein n=1 Tax=Candidatus Gallacutalibacter pullicola TaxID=2840830 RepID=A0A9D1DPR6_9FIRM|nr:zinc ribbon domain-containing protein [Candidatus Gallacutalibacter pullicola]
MIENCPNCGKPVNKEAKYCGNCGFVLSASAAGENAVSQPTISTKLKKKNSTLFPLILGIAVISFTLFRILSPDTEDPTSSSHSFSYVEAADPNTDGSARFRLTIDEYVDMCNQNMAELFSNDASMQLEYIKTSRTGNVSGDFWVFGSSKEYNVVINYETATEKIREVAFYAPNKHLSGGGFDSDFIALLSCLWEPLSGNGPEECAGILNGLSTDRGNFFTENNITYFFVTVAQIKELNVIMPDNVSSDDFAISITAGK